MYEVRCANANQAHDFDSMFCNVHDLVKEDDTTEATSERCWNCNSNEWIIARTSLTEKEYFKKLLQEPDGTIGYHVIDFGKSYYSATTVRGHTPESTK